jgi:porphobilinogen deaminase
MTLLTPTPHPTPITTLTVGTRNSQLAIAQVDSIIAQLKASHPSPENAIEYIPRVVSTMADENQSGPKNWNSC